MNETDLHCLNIIENSRGLSAGELATQSGLTAAQSPVWSTDSRAPASPVASPTQPIAGASSRGHGAFYNRADRIWGPMAADWQSTLARRFTTEELQRITDFLRASNELGRRHLDRWQRCHEPAVRGRERAAGCWASVWCVCPRRTQTCQHPGLDAGTCERYNR